MGFITPFFSGPRLFLGGNVALGWGVNAPEEFLVGGFNPFEKY